MPRLLIRSRIVTVPRTGGKHRSWPTRIGGPAGILRRLSLFCCLIFPLLASGAATASGHPRIGLVLSGGGARGFAHLGILEVLEELRIPIDAIAATSMGALVGGTYAAGTPVSEVQRKVIRVDWDRMFEDDPDRAVWPTRRKQAEQRPTWDFTIGYGDGRFKLAKGVVEGQKVSLLIAELVQPSEEVEDFDQLPIPFRAVATNLTNGKMKVFDHGPLSQALRASMSVPGLFAPVEMPDGLYVDGGLVRNLPIDIARQMGVDVVIAVNLGSSYLGRDELGTLLGVASQMIAILTEQNVEKSLRQIDPEKDILIVPKLGDISSGAFDQVERIIEIGRQAGREAAPQLRRYSLSEEEYRKWRQQHFGPPPPPPVIDDVRVAGLKRVNPELFIPLKRDLEGKPLDRATLERDLSVLYGRGDFEQLNYQLARQQGRNLLIVDAVEKSWGPGYLSFGIGFLSDYQGDTRFGARAVYNRTWVNRLGAEWMTELTVGNESSLFTEFYQPFRLDRAGFVAPYLDVGQNPLSLFLDDTRIARFDVLRGTVGVDIGTTFGDTAELRLGPYGERVRFTLDTGDPFVFPEGTVNLSGVRGRFLLDTLDSPNVPTRGHRIDLSLKQPLTALGADGEYTRVNARLQSAFSLRKHTFFGSLQLGSSLDRDMPYFDQFPLGGFLKLSGYPNEIFRGNDMAYANLLYYKQISTLPAPLGRGLYIGGSLETGKVWNTPGDGILNPEEIRFGSSIFFAVDSLAGPFFVAFGLSGEGDTTVYILLGRP